MNQFNLNHKVKLITHRVKQINKNTGKGKDGTRARTLLPFWLALVALEGAVHAYQKRKVIIRHYQLGSWRATTIPGQQDMLTVQQWDTHAAYQGTRAINHFVTGFKSRPTKRNSCLALLLGPRISG